MSDRTLARQVGARLRAVRRERGLTLRELGARLSPPVTYATLVYVEAGQTKCDLDRLAAIAAALGTDVQTLLGPALAPPPGCESAAVTRLRRENDRLRTALRLIGAQAEIAAGLAGDDGDVVRSER